MYNLSCTLVRLAGCLCHCCYRWSMPLAAATHPCLYLSHLPTPCLPPRRYAMPREQLRAIIAEAEQICSGGGSRPRQTLTTTDATMLLTAFENYSSAEGLAFLKR